MAAFRRVEAERAGPDALGILVPPARRTFIILRPRALPWDLLLCRGADDLTFRDLAHDEASAAAQGLFRALREAPARVEVVADAVRVLAGAFALVACPRQPGRPYAPLAGASAEAVARLLAALCPPPGEEREVYFNMRHFEPLPAGRD
jgi:hypothetical protein